MAHAEQKIPALPRKPRKPGRILKYFDVAKLCFKLTNTENPAIGKRDAAW